MFCDQFLLVYNQVPWGRFQEEIDQQRAFSSTKEHQGAGPFPACKGERITKWWKLINLRTLMKKTWVIITGLFPTHQGETITNIARDYNEFRVSMEKHTWEKNTTWTGLVPVFKEPCHWDNPKLEWPNLWQSNSLRWPIQFDDLRNWWFSMSQAVNDGTEGMITHD